MADTDANGYNDEASDFKRNNNKSNQEHEEDDQETQQQSQKAQEYIKGMMAERMEMERKYPIADRLLEVEIESVQKSGKPPARRYIDIYREKHIKVTVKVLVPVKEHPRFNFVGKLLGPKGNTLKRLQEDTMCRMAILGRGSMKDRKREEELRNGMDTKYAHLCDDLHVDVSANGPPAEVHARIAYALAELRKYLIPDSNDFIRQEQLREMMEDMDSDIHIKKPPFKKQVPMVETMPVAAAPPPPTMAPVRAVPPQKKVLSILDKARAAMEETYGARPVARYEEPTYEHAYEPPGYSYHQSPHAPPPPRPKYAPAPEAAEYEPEYRQEYYHRPEPARPYPGHPKPAPVVATRPWKPLYAGPPRAQPEEIPGKREMMPRYRHAPYSRPTK
ncbi:KH domain-containing, RNA-binding, signal transduction-associated protein 2-like [Uranotaenia lowii]|uniref:KH domain-containing, RNA-binding, signal transduction-associated protein 2-like n=1 Tax=Uranotaenia lowii TaxID=190385 RepID=UPI00247A3B74|nr:KH domain-containing, RNA-binding, signal transduction-associated protein 2-like [Uranotaenia lowii]